MVAFYIPGIWDGTCSSLRIRDTFQMGNHSRVFDLLYSKIAFRIHICLGGSSRWLNGSCYWFHPNFHWEDTWIWEVTSPSMAHHPWLPSPTSCTCLGKGTSFSKPAESTALLHQIMGIKGFNGRQVIHETPRTKWVNSKIAGMFDDVWRGSSQIWEWWEWFIRFDLPPNHLTHHVDSFWPWKFEFWMHDVCHETGW